MYCLISRAWTRYWMLCAITTLCWPMNGPLTNSGAPCSSCWRTPMIKWWLMITHWAARHRKALLRREVNRGLACIALSSTRLIWRHARSAVCLIRHDAMFPIKVKCACPAGKSNRLIESRAVWFTVSVIYFYCNLLKFLPRRKISAESCRLLRGLTSLTLE